MTGWHGMLRRLGLDVIRWPVGTSVAVDFVSVAEKTSADVVVDVGANIGDFAVAVRARGFPGRIVSFEPGSTSGATLVARASRDARWDVYRMALGDKQEELTLNVPVATDLASFLPVSNRGEDHFAEHLATVRSETVQVERLDAIWDTMVGGDRAMVKVDTQGWERHVLEGASGVLDRIVGLQVELSVNSYYDGAPDYLEMLAWLRELGFSPTWFHPISWHDGSLGEIDCVLCRAG